MAATTNDGSYDLVVVGGGPAGEKAAAQAAYWGKSVALVERAPVLGGTMVGGAVSNKTMREAALYLTSYQSRGLYDVGIDLTPAAAMARLRSRTDHVIDVVAETTAANMRRHQVDVLHGTARLGAERVVTVTGADGGRAILRGEVVLLAPGSRAFRPPGVPFDDADVLDADDAARLDTPLERVAVVGGGAVGCELASIFLALGADVTLIDSGPRLLPFMDAEVSDRLAATFRAAGMHVMQGAGRATVERRGDDLEVRTADSVVRPQKVIFATGRSGNTDGLLDDDAGVEVDERGRIVVDRRFETTAAGVYAAGDVVGPPALASVSMEQARVAMCWAFDLPLKRDVEATAPFGVYSIPEVAMAGLTEDGAREVGFECIAGRSEFVTNMRATIAGSTGGFLKLVVATADRRLLGVHILGSAATELVHLGQTALHFAATVDHFVHMTFNAPTVSEAYKYAAYDALGRLPAGRAAR